jgi:hypothetical protein
MYEVTCQEYGQTHQAEFSHEGRWNQGPIYAVVCTVDNLVDYYTSEVVREVASPSVIDWVFSPPTAPVSDPGLAFP